MKPLLIIQRLIPHYRVAFFKALAERHPIFVVHGQEPPGSYLTDIGRETSFPHRVVHNRYLSARHETWVYQSILSILRNHKPAIVVSEFALGFSSTWLLALLKPFFKYSLIYWTHGYDHRRLSFSPDRCLPDRLRLRLLQCADALWVYGSEARFKLCPWLSHLPIHVIPNTIDVTRFLSYRQSLEGVGRQSVKRERGLRLPFYLVFIGRLLQGKEVDFLLTAYEQLRRKRGDVGLLIIGRGPEQPRLVERVRHMTIADIHFLGEITSVEALSPWLFASDLLTLPGDVGLSAIQGFCFGLPLVTQKADATGPRHGPEIAHVIDGETGFLVPRGSIDAFVAAIETYLDNPEMQDRMRARIQLVLSSLSIDQMVDAVCTALKAMGTYSDAR